MLLPCPVHARTHVKQVVTGSGAEARIAPGSGADAGIAKQNSINITPMTKRFMGVSSFFETLDFSDFRSPFEKVGETPETYSLQDPDSTAGSEFLRRNRRVSLASQANHGVDLGRPARGNVARQERGNRNQEHSGQKDGGAPIEWQNLVIHKP